MSKHTIALYRDAGYADLPPDVFEVSNFRATDRVICSVPVEVDIPEIPAAEQIAQHLELLAKEQATALADHAKAMQVIEEKRRKLLAITYQPAQSVDDEIAF